MKLTNLCMESPCADTVPANSTNARRLHLPQKQPRCLQTFAPYKSTADRKNKTSSPQYDMYQKGFWELREYSSEILQAWILQWDPTVWDPTGLWPQIWELGQYSSGVLESGNLQSGILQISRHRFWSWVREPAAIKANLIASCMY